MEQFNKSIRIEPYKSGEREIVKELLTLLNNVTFRDRNSQMRSGAKTHSRANIINNDKSKKLYTMNFGIVNNYFKPKGQNLVLSRESRQPTKKPIWDLLKKLINTHNPSFKYTSILVNNDVKTEYHFDRNNNGNSYCIGIGNFKGGGIDFKVDDKQVKNIDNRDRWLYYNGKEWEHKTASYTGNRYAIIYYSKK